MMKAIGCLVFFVGLVLYSNKADMITTYAILSGSLFYVLPFFYRKMQASSDKARWEKQANQQQLDRANAAENAHQTALRHEREQMEMRLEMRIKELIATLEIQFRIDERKTKLLAEMKAEFANRQQADMATMLARLEALRAAK